MLHFLNFYILQWLFIRLARKMDDLGVQCGWTVLFVLPISGYFNLPFVYWLRKPNSDKKEETCGV